MECCHEIPAMATKTASRPSAINWVSERMAAIEMLWLYVAGNGIPQFVTDANAAGACLDVGFVPPG